MKKGFYEYYRKDDNLKGVVVAIDKGIIGWSMCDPKDVFSKEQALKIAYGRAEKALELKGTEKISEFYHTVPRSLHSLFDKIFERSVKYFKDDYNG